MNRSEHLEQLRLDLWEDDIRRHPSMAATFPKSYFPKPKLSDKTANGLTQCIEKYIRLHGGQVERIVVMGKPVVERDNRGRVINCRFVKSQMTIGTADISATIHGRSVKIEVKIGSDRQSEEQRRYQRQVEAAGGLYYIAHTFDDFVEWYKTMWP